MQTHQFSLIPSDNWEIWIGNKYYLNISHAEAADTAL